MLRFIVGRLFGAVIVLWVIVTLSFFLMRFAPGSPFDEDRKLPPAVEANKWIVYGMGVEVTSPVAGIVTQRADLIQGGEYPSGTLLCKIKDAKGTSHDVVMDNGGQLVSLQCIEGAEVAQGDRMAVIPKSLLSQYLTSLGNYAKLDFGTTISSDGTRRVSENLALGFPVSLELGLWAMVVALFFGITTGLLAGLRANTWVDYTTMSFAMIGISVPTIVSGPLVILLFIHVLDLFPYGGWGEVGPWWSLLSSFVIFACAIAMPKARRPLLFAGLGFLLFFFFGNGWEAVRHKVLPAFTLGFVYMASFARLTRGGMLEVISSDYIRTARAKGLSERDVVLKHAFKGAILPTISFTGPAIARIVTGSIVVERIFAIPGLAEYFVTPALNRDYPMVLGVVVVYSALLIVMNLLVDIMYTVLDPRVTYD